MHVHWWTHIPISVDLIQPPLPTPPPITERGNKFWKSKYSVIFLPLTIEFLIVLWIDMSLRRRFELNFGINVGFPLNLRLQWREIWWKQTFTYVGNENLPKLTATILPEWRANVHTTHPTDAAPQFLQNLNPPYSPPPIQMHDGLFNSSAQFLFFLKLNKSNKPNPLRRNMTSC